MGLQSQSLMSKIIRARYISKIVTYIIYLFLWATYETGTICHSHLTEEKMKQNMPMQLAHGHITSNW